MYLVSGIYYTSFTTPEGKQIRRSTGTGNKKEAERIEASIRAGVLSGAIKMNDSMTVKQGFDKALRTVWKNHKGWKTLEINSRTIVDLLGDSFLLSDVSAKVISELREKLHAMDYSVATVNRKLGCLGSLLSIAKDTWEVIDTRPRITMEKENNARTRLVTKAEELSMLKVADQDLADLLVVLMDTGARLGEILKLKPNHIDYQKGVMYFIDRKGGDNLGMPMSDRVLSVFNRRETCFQGLTKDSLEHRFRKAKSLAGITDKQFVMHSYRHTCATRLLEIGVPIYTVQAWLGHEDISTTQRYAKLTGIQLTSALELLNRANNSPSLKVVTVGK